KIMVTCWCPPWVGIRWARTGHACAFPPYSARRNPPRSSGPPRACRTLRSEDHGYLLVSPLGWNPMGAYGTCLRLPAVFGQAEPAAQQRTTACVQNAQTLERSEQDVINVLEMV